MHMTLYGAEEEFGTMAGVRRGWFWMAKYNIKSYNECVASFACCSCLNLPTSGNIKLEFILIH